MKDHIICKEEALTRFGGNEAIFKTLLKKFADNPYFHELELALSKDSPDLVKAEQAAHTLKGVAGNLSLSALFEAATALNKDLKEQVDYLENYTNLKDIYALTMEKVVSYIAGE